MDPQKLFKEQKDINNCQACGRPKLSDHMCIYCFTYLTKLFKTARRLGLNRPTLNSAGLFASPGAPKPGLGTGPPKSLRAREFKYEVLKEEYEKDQAAAIKRKNARRTQLNLPLLDEQGQIPPNAPLPRPPSRFNVVERMRPLWTALKSRTGS